MKKSCWPLWLFICAAVRRSWTSTSACCSARIPPPPLRKSLPRPKKRQLPLRILPNNAGRNRTKHQRAHRQSVTGLWRCALFLTRSTGFERKPLSPRFGADSSPIEGSQIEECCAEKGYMA